MVRFNFLLVFIVLISGCANAPKIVPGKGAVFGVVSADSHKALVEKAAKEKDVIYSEGGEIVYDEHMVNYSKLNEIYVCLIDPNFQGGNEHLIVVDNSKVLPRSLALAKGDILRIKNNTSKPQEFFLTDSGDGIQSLASLAPGQEGTVTVSLEGNVELFNEESEKPLVFILSRRGLVGQRHSSGDMYSFEKLSPGSYKIVFWFWRLGFIEEPLVIEKEKNTRKDQVLSVDRIISRQNES